MLVLAEYSIMATPISELLTIYDANEIAIYFYKDLSQETPQETPQCSDCECSKCECELEKMFIQRRKKVPCKSRKKRAHPVGEDKRWNPEENTVTKKGSPADQKAWRNKRIWRQAFVVEEIDVYEETAKAAKVKKPVYDKPCQGPPAEYCRSKWPECPGVKRVYVTPKWPVYN